MLLDEIGALFLDVGGTLVRPAAGVGGEYARVAREALGRELPADALAQRFGEQFRLRIDAARRARRLAYGRTDREARVFWRGVVEEVFFPFERDPGKVELLFSSLYDHFATPAAWSVFPDALELLSEARLRGLPVIAVSNWDVRLPGLLHRLGLAGHLTATVASYAVGAEKPDPRIFRAALAALPEPLEPEDVLHVGDGPVEDLEGARAVGLRALLLERGGAGRGPNSIRSLDDLLVRPA